MGLDKKEDHRRRRSDFEREARVAHVSRGEMSSMEKRDGKTWQSIANNAANVTCDTVYQDKNKFQHYNK